MQDQVSHSFSFIITPLQIISSTKSIKLAQKKSVFIKLGSKTQKTQKLNEPMRIDLDVLYSHTLKKYCPVKGIIKIYDIGQDGNEVISSVGGFQTEDLLGDKSKDVTVQRDVGTSKLKMRLQIVNNGMSKMSKTNASDVQKKQSLLKNTDQIKQEKPIPQIQRSVKPAFRKSIGEGQTPKLQPKLHQQSKAPSKLIERKTSLKVGQQRPESTNTKSLEDLQKQINDLKGEVMKKDQQIRLIRGKDKEKSSVWKQLEQKQTLCQQLQRQVLKLQQQNKSLLEQNQKHKEKQGQMELIIFNKQNMVETLRQQIDELSITYREMQDTLCNDQLIIEQLREETANLNEVIENYRSKFGDLKKVKDKALENQLKDCLMWIDQQTRDLEEDSPAAEHCISLLDNVETASSIEDISEMLKSLELQRASHNDLQIIRQEMSRLIMKIDSLKK